MSHAFDRKSQNESPAAVGFEISTRGVAARERAEFWASRAGARMKCMPAPGQEHDVAACVRGISGLGIEFVDYRSRGLWMDRTERMCRTDGRDEICLGLALGAGTGAVQKGRELRLHGGDLYLIDFAHPVRSIVRDHHELALILPRAWVAEAMGCDPARFGGLRLPSAGVSQLLAAHLRAIAGECAALDVSSRILALRVAEELAFATLQAAVRGDGFSEQLTIGLHASALTLIHRYCTDVEFTPEQLAVRLGCSRATLYRLFAGRDDSLASVIQSARLERAHGLLVSSEGKMLTIGEIGFRCGFLDHATFTRSFKRRYGLTPREFRERSVGTTIK